MRWIAGLGLLVLLGAPGAADAGVGAEIGAVVVCPTFRLAGEPHEDREEWGAEPGYGLSGRIVWPFHEGLALQLGGRFDRPSRYRTPPGFPWGTRTFHAWGAELGLRSRVTSHDHRTNPFVYAVLDLQRTAYATEGVVPGPDLPPTREQWGVGLGAGFGVPVVGRLDLVGSVRYAWIGGNKSSFPWTVLRVGIAYRIVRARYPLGF